jgi:hypothetical protein
MKSIDEMLLEFAEDVEQFQLGHCSPSDDPDKQTAYLYAFKDVAKRFVGTARRVNDVTLRTEVARLNMDPKGILEAYDLRADLIPIIDLVRQRAGNWSSVEFTSPSEQFLDPVIIERINSTSGQSFNLSKLISFSTELNQNYSSGNYLSCALLIRAIINHIPPLFGCRTFSQVVATSGRSVKGILAQLEEGARDIGDLHSHEIIDRHSSPPTRNQVEPYKPCFEVLYQEIERRVGQKPT